MRERAKRFVGSGLDRALSALGFKGEELDLAHADTLDWARMRARAARVRRGFVGGLGVVVTRPGRAELRPLEAALPGPGELTVEVLASAISAGTERAQWLRLPNAQPHLPFAPGYSGAGRVIAAGRDVDDGLDVGTLVAVPRARHASVVTVPADWTTPVPASVRVEEAALVYLAIIAGYGVRRASAVAGEQLCVIGVGPIGALAHRLAMLQGPGQVTVVGATRRGEDAALRAGAARFLTAADGADGIEAAAVIEATGDPDGLRAAVAAARPGGTVVLLGSPRGVTRDAALAEIQRKGLRVVGAHVSALAAEARRDNADPFGELSRTFLQAVADRRLAVSDLAGEAVDPREIGLLYGRLARAELHAAHLDWTRLPRAERVRRRRPMSLPELRKRVPAIPGEPMTAARPTGRPLRFAVIGCGDIGFSNARAIAAAANAEVALCHDQTPALAAAAAARHGGEVAASLEEALDRTRVDAVFLSVPHDLHAPLAIRAAEAGLHVVVEKPLAVDLPAAEEIAAAATEAGVALSVCFSYRYYPTVQAARALVKAGALGPLRGVTVLFHADKPPSYWSGGFSGRAASGWRASRSRAGGGVLIMNLAHYVDLIRYVGGAEPAWVAGAGRTDEGAEVEDAVALAVGFGGGAIGSFSGSASTRGAPATRFELWGELGTLRLEPDPAIYTERALDGVVAGRWSPLAADAPDDTRRVFVERFADAVLSGRPPEVTAADGLAVQAFLDAGYRAIEDGEPVTLEEPSAARA
jgi:2-desacetyl-2-hydroxyethyl bacteriochlorophyllide A dehydrogenase